MESYLKTPETCCTNKKNQSRLKKQKTYYSILGTHQKIYSKKRYPQCTIFTTCEKEHIISTNPGKISDTGPFKKFKKICVILLKITVDQVFLCNESHLEN